MAIVAVVLGDFLFNDFEIPENLIFGGSQNLVIHQNIGGSRVIDLMGSMPSEIQWSGTFLGLSAIERARYLQNLMQQGQELTFTYFDFNYTVVIRQFEANLSSSWIVPFNIVLTVVSDNTTPVNLIFPPSVSSLVQEAYIQALDIAGLIKDPGLSSKIALLGAAISTAGNFTDASFSEIAAVLGAAQDAINSAGQIAGGL